MLVSFSALFPVNSDLSLSILPLEKRKQCQPKDVLLESILNRDLPPGKTDFAKFI